MENFLNNLETFNEIDYVRTFISFICCIVLSFSLKYIYIEKSISLAENKNYLTDIRKNIFDNALKTPLFNGKKFSDGFFTSLKKVYN